MTFIYRLKITYSIDHFTQKNNKNKSILHNKNGEEQGSIKNVVGY